MANVKHVGRIAKNKRRCIVAYRTIPNDPYSALVLLTESMPADEHDALMSLVESPAGQQADELADAMARARLPDGRIMLAGFHKTGQLRKVATNEIEMIPNSKTSIMLNELNEIIAQQKGVALEDLAVKPTTQQEQAPKVEDEAAVDAASLYTQEPAPAATQAETGVLSDEDLAAQYRSQADAMFKEAKRLREQAEELSPTKKKPTTRKKEDSVKA